MIAKIPRRSFNGADREGWLTDARRFERLAEVRRRFYDATDENEARRLGWEMRGLQDQLGLARSGLGAVKDGNDE